HNPTSPQDLLDILLLAEQTDIPINIHAELMTFFQAGFKSLSATLCWVWILLDRHPDVRERLEAELVQYPIESPVTLKQLSQLKYTKAVFYETMRLYPALPGITRVAKQSDEINHFLIPKNRKLIIFNYNSHVNPKYWT